MKVMNPELRRIILHYIKEIGAGGFVAYFGVQILDEVLIGCSSVGIFFENLLQVLLLSCIIWKLYIK